MVLLRKFPFFAMRIKDGGSGITAINFARQNINSAATGQAGLDQMAQSWASVTIDQHCDKRQCDNAITSTLRQATM